MNIFRGFSHEQDFLLDLINKSYNKDTFYVPPHTQNVNSVTNALDPAALDAACKISLSPPVQTFQSSVSS